MGKPKNKEELLEASRKEFQQLWTLISQMSEQEQEADFTFPLTEKDSAAHFKRDRNLRDVLIHLYEWQNLLLNWLKNNQTSDQVVPFLPDPYHWKNYGEMNEKFWEKQQKTSLAEAKALLLNSHEKVTSFMNHFSEEELFTKKYFNWTGTTNLSAYFISSTSSHYLWAIKKIKRQLKSRKEFIHD